MTYVVRVWMPDRPGALGQVASRIGAVGGDVVGIDILERGAGRAIDELVVELPDDGPGRPARAGDQPGRRRRRRGVAPGPTALHDPRLDALETAAILVGASTRSELLEALCDHAVPRPSARSGRWSSSSTGRRRWPQEGAAPPAAVARSPSCTAASPSARSRRRRRPRRRRRGPRCRGRAGPGPGPRRHRRSVPGSGARSAALARIVDTRFRELMRARVTGLAHPSTTLIERPSRCAAAAWTRARRRSARWPSPTRARRPAATARRRVGLGRLAAG